jgi:hypothetical protein
MHFWLYLSSLVHLQYQFPVYAHDANLFGEKLRTTKKNTGSLWDAIVEAGLEEETGKMRRYQNVRLTNDSW